MEVRGGLPTTPGPPGRPPNHIRTTEMASRPLLDLREGLPTTSVPLGRPLDHSQRSGCGREAFPEVREWSGGPP